MKKIGPKISLYGPTERKMDKTYESMIDLVHIAIKMWIDSNSDLENFLLNNVTDHSSFWLYCQAISESLLFGTKEKSLLEGFLLSKDKYLKEIRAKKDRNVKRIDDYL